MRDETSTEERASEMLSSNIES